MTTPTSKLDAELAAWIGDTVGPLLSATQLVGGNRRQAWAISCRNQPPFFLRFAGNTADRGADIYSLEREALVYEALQGRSIAIPRLVARHPTRPAILVEHVPGASRFVDCPLALQNDVARNVVEKLAALHGLDAASLTQLGPSRTQTMRQAVAEEISRWRTMYEEAGRFDPLIDFALAWLDENLPDTPCPAVLTHGDAGPGNFLFQDDKVTALVDWELWHLGDPMEDLAWLSMRTTLEPFPDFPGLLRAYACFTKQPIATRRLLYHRVFVPLRVVIIRHRALGEAAPDGDRANSLISRTLNRRLLVEALCAATDTHLPPPPAPPSPVAQPEYDYVLALLSDKIAPRTSDNIASAAIKSAARMIKFLAARHAHGPSLAAATDADCAALLGIQPSAPEKLEAALHEAIADRRLPQPALLTFFSRQVARETQLAAGTLGALATRSMPPVE